MASGIDGIGGGARVPGRPEAGGAAADPRRPVAETGGTRDRIELSPQARNAARLNEAAQALPDVRSERVEALRDAIATETYHVSSRDVARAILELEHELGGS